MSWAPSLMFGLIPLFAAVFSFTFPDTNKQELTENMNHKHEENTRL